MRRPCLVRIGLAAIALAVAPVGMAAAGDGGDTFSVAPQQAVSFGDGDGDSFAVENISRHENAVTVLLRPKGETCLFRFQVGVGRSVQLRSDAPSGQSMLCKATLHPITTDGNAEFEAECNEEPVSHERKCPPDGDTASVDAVDIYPQH